MDILVSLLPICLAVFLGMLAGKFLPSAISLKISKMIGPFVWVLLFAIGYKFGLVIENLKNIAQILKLATIFSIGISLVVGICVYLIYERKTTQQRQHHETDLGITHVLKECAFAFLSIIIGCAVAQGLISLGWDTSLMPSTDVFLYILLFMIGVDIINAPINFKAISPRLIFMPIAIIISSAVGGVALAALLDMDLRYGLIFSAGFGWFSLSGVMVTSHLGEYYGAIALLTDLFRELFSIVILFFWGARYPDSSIATAGATAMDTTLPIIKKASGNQYIAQALYIGVVLSLVVPFWLGFLLSFF